MFSDIVAQCFERRDVNDLRFIRQMIFRALSKQCVERSEKRSQRFARSSRRGNQRMPAGLNGRPTAHLWLRRRTQMFVEPPGQRRVETRGRPGNREVGKVIYIDTQ